MLKDYAVLEVISVFNNMSNYPSQRNGMTLQ